MYPSNFFTELENTVVLTIDVEDYFMSPESIPFEAWDSFPSRINLGMERVLNLLNEFNAKATFFFVGWLAERYPEIVQWTLEQGHEVGIHTYNHAFVNTLNQAQFEQSIKRSIDILKKIVSDSKTEQEIIGHRAPGFSLQRSKTWQFDVLKRYGIQYDSSINPHATYLYGDHDAPIIPYRLHDLCEIPPGCVELLGKRWPVGGGGTLRILPKRYLQWARERYLAGGFPPVIYMHPWEFVPEHPQLDLPFKQKIIHWWGIKSVDEKLRALLSDYSTIRMDDYFRMLVGT